jgi:uncharacterized phage-associated protein
MRPAIRSTLDIVLWYEKKAVSAATDLPPQNLQKLLYLSQTLYAARHEGAKMMPATFLATSAGPIEPDVFLILEQGISEIEPVVPSESVKVILEEVWDTCGALSIEQLDHMLAYDTAFKAASARERNSEILIDEMATSFQSGLRIAEMQDEEGTFPDGSSFRPEHKSLDAAPSEAQEVRFTADGRSVTRWTPKRKVSRKEIKSLL